MKNFLVSFIDGGNCEIEQVCVSVRHVNDAIIQARTQILDAEGQAKLEILDDETVSVTILGDL